MTLNVRNSKRYIINLYRLVRGKEILVHSWTVYGKDNADYYMSRIAVWDDEMLELVE